MLLVDINHFVTNYDSLALCFRSKNPYRNWLVARTMSSPGLFHAMATFVEARLQMLLPWPDHDAPKRLAYHRGEAIADVRRCLEKRDGIGRHDTALDIVMTLANTDVCSLQTTVWFFVE